jgi:hypothetical protein
VRIDRQLLVKNARSVLGLPKTASSFRTIPLPGFVGDALAAHIAAHGVGPVLHQPDGRPLIGVASATSGRRR